jgi:hypothetical protein
MYIVQSLRVTSCCVNDIKNEVNISLNTTVTLLDESLSNWATRFDIN